MSLSPIRRMTEYGLTVHVYIPGYSTISDRELDDLAEQIYMYNRISPTVDIA